jgi:hypothetical protein
MRNAVITDAQKISQHRAVWAVRPELRSVYQEWFAQRWRCLEGRRPGSRLVQVRDFSSSAEKKAFDADPFIALPYLATLGFKSARPIPQTIVDIARFGERLLSPVRKLQATRILIVWEQALINGSLN